MLFKYIASLYAKHLFFILLALVSFFVFFDYILTINKLPDASNLQMLYISFKAMEGVEILWQISMIFAFITSWVSLVRSNALVSIFSFGYSKKAVIAPFLGVFALCYVVMIFIQMTEFSYAKDRASQIRSHGAIGSVTKDIFFHYDGNYVYMKRLYPLQQRAEDLRIFTADEDKFLVIYAKEAFYDNNQWLMPEVEYVTLSDQKVVTKSEENFISLHNFKPRVLETVYESGSGFTIIDAFLALEILFAQGVNTDRVRAVIFNKILTPFFVLILMVIYFYKLPLHARFGNLALVTTVFITVSLFIWGVIFALFKLTSTGAISPEIGMIIPLVAMLSYMTYLLKKKDRLN